jgi:Mlc titration factor MtfA (ptsG expression regulator)
MHLSEQKKRLNRNLALLVSVLIFLIYVAVVYRVYAQNPSLFYILLAIGGLVAYNCFGIFTKKMADRESLQKVAFPDEWKKILEKDVAYYRALSEDKKRLFETEIQIFLHETRITGIKCEVDDRTMILAAASAEIPVFAFEDWEYNNLGEILIYPGAFTKDFRTEGEGRNVWGMVGTGVMQGIMILSKPALLGGFENAQDKQNVGIHEFAHLLDAADGVYDGVPRAFLEHKYIAPWLAIMHYETQRIHSGESKMNPYAATAPEEFFAVATEYFFEHPEVMHQRKPELYELLCKVFQQDTKSKYKNAVLNMFNYTGIKVGRNAPCPCGSGEKYKNCCLKNARSY